MKPTLGPLSFTLSGQKSETRHEITTRVSKEIILAGNATHDAKTARLRAARLLQTQAPINLVG